ncbi:MAG: hypothetical protein CFE43_15285 [Burkholderiales bacterium PBB3]|nr:MAG: hypothetical protein CFE43_15285 [Burkholderiales bacterium PBB3]
MPHIHRSHFTWNLLRAAAAALALGLACNAASAMTLREMRALEKSDKKQGENYINYFLVGAMEGALEAHNQAVRNGAKPSICLNGRRLEPHMARSLFDTELKRNVGVYEADMSVQLVIANALTTVYAC